MKRKKKEIMEAFSNLKRALEDGLSLKNIPKYLLLGDFHEY